MNHYIKLAVFCLGALLVFAACGNNNRKSQQATEAEQQEAAVADSIAKAEQNLRTMDKIATLPEEPIFEIITNLGVIKIKLYAQTPKHRENFAKLAIERYYDGILFHRVINGFMIQAGDPLTKDPANANRFGTGGPDYNVPAEILPELHHKKGALAAARRGDAANPMRESSGSQFYIVQDEMACSALDGQYTVFGETIEGLDVIDKIASVQTNGRDCPINDVKIITIKLAE